MKPTIMKYFYCLFIFSVFIPSSNCQTLIEDAIELSSFLKPLEHSRTIAQFDPTNFIDHCTPILKKYTLDPNDISEFSDLLDEFTDNPFMGRTSNPTRPFIAMPDNIQDEAPIATGVKGSSVGIPGPGAFVTNLADGLAKFLVKRTKEELTVAFFQKFASKTII